jgi:P4 family phage/plasmid primase-like protien
MIAFKNFKEIDSLPTIQEKHRAWLRDYEGMNYSIANEGKHLMKWVTDPKKYSDDSWRPEINCIKELKNRCRIEFDGDKDEAKKNLEKIYNKLKEFGFGFIRSTHKGKSDYLWIEFTRDLKDKEKEAFLLWLAPEESEIDFEIDLNFASSRKVFPVLYATHWKHSFKRELPVEYFEGNKIDFDSLKIKVDDKKIIKRKIKNRSFEYVTGIKEASKIFTIEGQAERFKELQPIFYDRSGMFWLWNDNLKCWEISDDVDILNMISESTNQDVITSKNRTEILNALKQKGRLNMPEPIKPTWIQFKDKVYDIETGESFTATPKYFVTNPIPYEVSGDPRTPTIDRIFEEWVGGDFVKTLYEIVAYCLLPDYPINRLFCFIGEGMNGKSCFLNLLKKFVGKNNVCSTELDTLITSRFEVTRLHKKLVCLMGETNFNEMTKTSIIKKLTGRDTIGFEYKNKNPFEDINYAKILIATNNLPATTDKTIGFYRRWMIIDFPNKFGEKKDILLDIPEQEYSNLATQSVIILNSLIKEREFTNEGSVEERMKRYEDRSNPLDKFLNEFTEEDPDSHIWKFEFQKKFSEWCRENKFRQFSEIVIGRKMKEKGFEQGLVVSDWLIDGQKKQLRAWRGMRWKEISKGNNQDNQDKQVVHTQISYKG